MNHEKLQHEMSRARITVIKDIKKNRNTAEKPREDSIIETKKRLILGRIKMEWSALSNGNMK